MGHSYGDRHRVRTGRVEFARLASAGRAATVPARVAIVDDVGAILVIAVFYSDGIDFTALGGAVAVLLIVLGMRSFGIARTFVYVVQAVVLWLALHESGVHKRPGRRHARTAHTRRPVNGYPVLDKLQSSIRSPRSSSCPSRSRMPV